jgi:hydroxypyruvate isomerase
MPRFAANLTTMFTEHPFGDRFRAAARAGFTAVECQFPYELSVEEAAALLNEAGLSLVLFNLPPGDWAAGERGIACIPGRQSDFRDALALALRYARALACPRLHAMSGLVPGAADRAEIRRTFVSNLRLAAAACADAGVELLIEPINNRDVPGYFMNNTALAAGIIEEIGAPNLGLQLDLYHCQISEGDLAMRIRSLLPLTRHVQIAGVPDRHEPDCGEVNYPYLFRLLDDLGYDGWVGCEYFPRGRTEDGLGWLHGMNAPAAR